MKIALIGYGKMGKAIEEIALAKGHEIVLKIDISNAHEFTQEHLSRADVAIEFTGPHSAFDNVMKCLAWGVPVVCGSTGWLDKWDEVKNYCEAQKGSLVYASNFSIGVNLFFEVNSFLARLMNKHPEYNVSMEEIHHTQKKDAPSGTAITLAEGILKQIDRKKNWKLGDTTDTSTLAIRSHRIDPDPGTHVVKYQSTVDDIEILHKAHSRQGFALGAVLVAEWIIDKKGILTMKDFLGF